MARTFVNEHDAIEYLLESEDAATRAAARVMGAKIDALEEALRDMLTAFEDYRRPEPSWSGWELADGTPVGDRFNELEARARAQLAQIAQTKE